LADLGRCPLPPLGGLCHLGLVEQMVNQYKSRKESYNDFPPINAACYITQHSNRDTGRIGAGKRPQATNRVGKREGVYLHVFTLR